MTLSFEILLPSATYLRQGYVFTGVCDSVHRGGWQTPPGIQSLGRHTPLGRCRPPEMATAADCTHPTGIHSRYRPKRSFGQGNIFTPVCHSFCSQGGRGSPSPGGFSLPPPRSRHPHWMENHPLPHMKNPPRMENHPLPDGEPPPPPPGSRLRHTVYDRPVHILLECILVFHIKSLNTSQCFGTYLFTI